MAGMSSRIGSGLVSGPGVTGTTQMAPSLNSTNHVVPNLQSMRRSSPNSSSQYSQWRIQKDLGGRCSWKFAAIFFVLLSVILVSALIYTTGKFHFPRKLDSSSSSAVLYKWSNFVSFIYHCCNHAMKRCKVFYCSGNEGSLATFYFLESCPPVKSYF